jgi:hypothetical protein
MTSAFLAAALLGSLSGGQGVVEVRKDPPKLPSPTLNLPPPKSRFQLAAPLVSIPGVMVDTQLNGWGLAHQTARSKGLQARILWVDATANIERYNDEAKIKNLVGTIAAAGFNTIVFDIKPISGHVVYPSRIAPKLTEWKGRILPESFDPLAVFVRECKAAGVSLMVSLNAFSEGHRDFKVGPGYATPELQTVLYEPQPVLKTVFGVYPVALQPNVMPPSGESLAVYQETSRIPGPEEGLFAVTLERDGRVVDGFEMGGIGRGVPTIPRGGIAVAGRGKAAEFLRTHLRPGQAVSFDTRPAFLPISARPESQVPLMMNPHHPEVQKRAIALAKEVVANYAVDGILYDDRMRYAGMDADFSPEAQSEFEKWVGRKLVWPDDVYKITFTPAFVRGIVPGPYYDAWLTWRALTLRNFVARVRQEIKLVRFETLFGVYAGSWYGEYPVYGSNWASTATEAGFWFLTPSYQKTGYAALLDVLITGCYYPTATIYEAMSKGVGIGVTVEAAGALTNRLARDRAWSYAGIMLSQFKDNPEGLERALQAACASTQGVMVFDLSHDIGPFWPVFRQAFGRAAKPPHKFPDVLRDATKKRQAQELREPSRERPIIVVAGAPGAGH